MSNWPIQTGGGAPFPGAGLDADIRIRRLTAGATPHTRGPWVEMIGACPAGMSGLALHVGMDNGGDRLRAMVDVAIGPPGGELVVAPSLPISGSFFQFNGWAVLLPLAFAPGTRVAVAVQSNIAASDAHFATVLPLVGGGLSPVAASTLVAMGDNRAATVGTLVQNDYGGGAWVEIIGATPVALRGLFVCWSNDTDLPSGQYSPLLTEIAAGGAGAERVVLERIATLRSDAGQAPHVSGPHWVRIPAGTRLSAKMWAGSSPLNPFVHLLGIV